jgi:hypothetical protein
MIILVVCEPDNSLITKTIVEASKEISYAKSVIGYHYCSFSKEGASAELNRLSLCITFRWEGHFPQVQAHGFMHVSV